MGHAATTTNLDLAARHEYSLRSISRKRNEKGETKTTKQLLGTREHSMNSALNDKLLREEKNNETMRKKKVIS